MRINIENKILNLQQNKNHEILKGKFHKVCARLVYKKLKNTLKKN